jgi:hypothetical protein
LRAAEPAYFDTSVLLKRYVAEAGSERARALLRGYRIVSSALAPVEALSGLARRRAVGDLADRHFSAIIKRMRVDRAFWNLLEVSPAVLDRAEHLVLTSSLRTADAIHVGTALVLQADAGRPVPFVTSDVQQREAAAKHGLTVIWSG